LSLTLNEITLLGRAGKDAEAMFVGGNNKSLCKFSMATGTTQHTQWHNIQAWEKIAAIAIRVKKGDLVLVKGMLNYNKTGDKIYAVINAGIIMNLGRKTQPEPEEKPEYADEGDYEVRPPFQGDDSDIPF
jgi:single-stranded DNA-binding protein